MFKWRKLCWLICILIYADLRRCAHIRCVFAWVLCLTVESVVKTLEHLWILPVSTSEYLLCAEDITFDNAPNPQNPKIYTDALIQCAVSGEPKPTVSWRYDGKRIPLGEDDIAPFSCWLRVVIFRCCIVAIRSCHTVDMMSWWTLDDSRHLCAVRQRMMMSLAQYSAWYANSAAKVRTDISVVSDCLVNDLTFGWVYTHGKIALVTCSIEDMKNSITSKICCQHLL